MAYNLWHRQDTYRSLLSISDAGFKYLALLNGGTWLSVLAFVDKLPPGSFARVAPGIELFVWSLGLTGLCYFMAYATNLRLYNEELRKSEGETGVRQYHRVPLYIGMVVYLGAVGLYMGGAWHVKGAFFPPEVSVPAGQFEKAIPEGN